jgi:cytochrome o ubiquinol oxidase operon protein cyoD
MSLQQKSHRVTLLTYVTGFILSVLLTLTAFLVVKDKLLNGRGLILILLGFATIQLVVQLLFFLHLDKESKPRWNLMTFLFAALVLLIVVGGSLWIMNSLNYRMGMSPAEIIKDEGIHR